MKLQYFKRLSSMSKVLALIAVITGLLAFNAANAALASGIALSSITAHVNSTVSQMARILTDVALIAGIAFILASFFKFHQHKLNPQQVPISQGVTLLLIGSALTLFVVMLPTAKRAIFGSAQITTVGGSQLSSIIHPK